MSIWPSEISFFWIRPSEISALRFSAFRSKISKTVSQEGLPRPKNTFRLRVFFSNSNSFAVFISFCFVLSHYINQKYFTLGVFLKRDHRSSKLINDQFKISNVDDKMIPIDPSRGDQIDRSIDGLFLSIFT